MIHSKPMQLYSAFIDSDINSLLDAVPDFANGLDCLITFLDSDTPKADAVRREIEPFEFETVGSGVVVSGAALLDVRSDFLTGFDEIYYFRKGSWRATDPKLFERHFTTERTQFKSGLPDVFTEIFRMSGAVRYTSDGAGLNLVCEDPNLMSAVKQALAHS